jgi:hypothetical protein
MKATYVIKEGRREVAFQASPYMRWSVVWANIFVDCSECDQSIGLRFNSDSDSNYFSDKEFVSVAQSKGWIVEPGKRILCRTCASKIV